MTYRARLRIELLDRPGALARLAGVLGERGINVVAIDVQEVEGDVAVDELVVVLPDDIGATELRRALDESGAGVLLSHSEAPRDVDNVVRVARWAADLFTAGPEHVDRRLEEIVAAVCSTPAAMVLPVDEARRWTAGRLALERGGPVSHRTGDVPPPLAVNLPKEAWILAVPDARIDPTRVAFAGRAMAVRFSATEVSRVEALLCLARHAADRSDRMALRQ